MLKSGFLEEDSDEDGCNRVISKESPEIEYLHYELGVDIDYLWDKLNQIIDSNYQLIDI